MNMIFIITNAINICALVICLLLILTTIFGGDLKRKMNFYFLLLNVFYVIGLINEICLVQLEGNPGRKVYILINFIEYLAYILVAFQDMFFILYLYEFLNSKIEVSKKMIHIAICINIFYILAAAVAQFYDLSFSLNDFNQYQKEKFLWVIFIGPILTMSFSFICLLKEIKHLKFREWSPMIFYLLIIAVCYVQDVIITNILLSYFAGSIALFIIFLTIQQEVKQELKEQKAEIMEKQIMIMISQIKPHFIYNTLTTIRGLCYGNPEARGALLSFSQYLRGNMDSLLEHKLISFDKELEHTQHYLYLESLRFEEKLHIRYEIENKDFFLPTLTLQPIVENAVAHGLFFKEEGGTITIGTKETADNFYIIVEDDGVGFDINEKELSNGEARSHVGISNVRWRLSAMCDGRLIIESVIGKGTIATIEIPKGRGKVSL